jgi:tRNA dimethylallyltransferase
MKMTRKKNVIFIVGQTATGKSSAAMEIAQKIDGEIVCADSQTVRRGMDVGTAKPSPEEQAAVPHHLVDVIGPYDEYSVHEFKKAAQVAIDDIQARGKTPIIVGGTGLYVDALFYDYSSEKDNSNQGYKKELNSMTVQELQDEVAEKGYSLPDNEQNPRHLIGVLLRGGRSYDDQQPMDGAEIYGIQCDDDVLKKRINSRVELMFKNGFVQEVKKLVKEHGRPDKKMDAIGYPIVLSYIDGEINIEEAKKLFKAGDWQYARRQKAWFKRNKHIKWMNTSEELVEKAVAEVTNC